MQHPVRWGIFRKSYYWSKAINDVSEFFFSAPVNNYNLREDRSRSDDDQRHRVSSIATAHTSLAPAGTLREKLIHGFLFSESFSTTPLFLSTSPTGGNTLQSTSQRPCAPGYTLAATASNPCYNAVPGSLIGRNAGTGFDSFNLNARLSRTIPLGERFHLEGIADAFNALNRRNNLFPNGTFGTGIYPIAPSSTFGQPTNAADPRSVQLALRLSF